jgi:hypothetical protein
LNDKSELPADEDGIVLVHTLAMSALLGVCFLCFAGMKKQYVKFGMIHLSAGALFTAIVLQVFVSFLFFFKAKPLYFTWAVSLRTQKKNATKTCPILFYNIYLLRYSPVFWS